MNSDFENDFCDLDPTKRCDNCCKCLEQPADDSDENGYRVIMAELHADGEDVEFIPELEQQSAIAALFDEKDEEEDADEVEPLNIPPELLAEWEAKLAASFQEDEKNNTPHPKLHASRKKRS
ncbi:MAG TPA: hypothetical protein PKB13_06520 [Clostridia bacterium]|nr:hypothetical protein [Clostridia bacterium]